jgi:RNA polymerase sigma-70 factor (ECF subfamily)
MNDQAGGDIELGEKPPAGGGKSGGLDPSDAELLAKAARGDGKAFGLLVHRHADGMFRLAASLVGNAADAEDVVQEALAGAFRGAGKFQGRSSVKTWLTRIVLTQSAIVQRDRKRRRLRQSDSAAQNVAAAGGTAGVEMKIDLHAALQRLSSEHRQVLALREFEHLSYADIAAALDLPVGTIESRLYRARSELKTVLRDYR